MAQQITNAFLNLQTIHPASQTGKIIGCCAGVAAHPTCLFVGLYAVRKKYQGFGIGLKTFQAVMKHVGNRVSYRMQSGYKAI